MIHPRLLLIAVAALFTSAFVEPVAAAPRVRKGLEATIPRSETAPSVNLRRDRAQIGQLDRIEPLTKPQKVELLAHSGIAVETTGLGAPTVLTVRNPYLNATTHLSFAGAVAVLPGQDGGTATVGPGAIVPVDLSAYYLFGDAAASKVVNFAAVEFRAAPNKHYIVDCTVAGGANGFATQVTIDGKGVDGGFSHSNGHALQLVASAPKSRTVIVQLLAKAEWSTRGCEITPVG
jgi:hypothetical protein